MFLWNGDEKNDRGSSKGSDWIRSVMGLDGILNQPNMLVGWISGQAARYDKICNHLNIGYSGIQMVKSCLVCKWSGIQMGFEYRTK